MGTPDLKAKLEVQLELLERAAGTFDDGNPNEALNLATRVRVLVHDTGSSRSLLGQLGMKDEVSYLDTSAMGRMRTLPMSDHPTGAHLHMAFGGLAAMRVSTNDQPRFIASLRSTGRWVGFQEWWGSPAVEDAADNQFSRRVLILAVANKDGGTHVDTRLDPAYESLSRHNSLGFVWQHQGESSPLEDPVPAYVRQIAHELLHSIRVARGAPPDR